MNGNFPHPDVGRNECTYTNFIDSNSQRTNPYYTLNDRRNDLSLLATRPYIIEDWRFSFKQPAAAATQTCDAWKSPQVITRTPLRRLDIQIADSLDKRPLSTRPPGNTQSKQRCFRHSTNTVSEFHAEEPQASEELAQGSYVAARAGFEPTTLRTKSEESTNEPPRPTIAYIIIYRFKYAH